MNEKDFENMPIKEQLKWAEVSLKRATSVSTMLAYAVLKYGKHEETCTDENVCNCELSSIQHMAADLIGHFEAMVQKESGGLN
jgi:hypothetical protein